jgi:DNA polymerase III delta prime subunit
MTRNNPKLQLDDGLAESVRLATRVFATVAMVGPRQFDRFVLPTDDGQARTLSLERICHEAIGATATWVYDPTRERVTLVRATVDLSGQKVLPSQEGEPAANSLIKLLDGFATLRVDAAAGPLVLIVDAGLLVEDSGAPRDKDFDLVRAMERYARTADPGRVLLLRAARTTDIPAKVLSSPLVRTVHIPAATRDTRFAYAQKRGAALAARCNVDTDVLARAVSDATEDWTLQQVEALLTAADSQGLARLHDIDELARAIRIGSAQSPWAGEQIRQAIAGAGDRLGGRVLGQPAAVQAVAVALRKAVIGLSSAHQSQGTQAPRATFFFAGPTGTGKTELAKAISQLVFGQDQLLRFDCGELRQEHAVARLLGAPPGYVGYDRGGELTEGIRAKPNSVVLFDEIEKAHPRLLDVLLGVLDDGRLTSGQGETAYFGQAVLIFTSNLGMYEEVPDDSGRPRRVPRFNYDTPFESIERTVREAIREEFVSVLGRPELLGRFGGAESIVVFDYLRDLERVCRKFVANIATTCQRLHGVELIVDDGIIEQVVGATRARPDALVLGGRGLKPELDRLLTNPLADYLFERAPGKCVLQVRWDHGRTVLEIPC